jgi:hypothetical protein
VPVAAPDGAVKFNIQPVVVIEVAEVMIGALNAVPVVVAVVLAVTLLDATDVPLASTDCTVIV